MLQGHYGEMSGLCLLLCCDPDPEVPEAAAPSPRWGEEGAGTREHAGAPDPATSERDHPSMIPSLPVSGGLALTWRPLGDEPYTWSFGTGLCRAWRPMCALRGPAARGVWSDLHPCVYPSPRK